MENQKNDSHYVAIASQWGKDTIDPSMSIVDEVKNDTTDLDNTPKDEIEKLLTNT